MRSCCADEGILLRVRFASIKESFLPLPSLLVTDRPVLSHPPPCSRIIRLPFIICSY
jgi:hypothetical protein